MQIDSTLYNRLRGQAGAQGVVFLGFGQAEHRHDTVAQDLVDDATILMDRVDHGLKDGDQRFIGVLGVFPRDKA